MFGYVARALMLASATLGAGDCQTTDSSAAEIIRFLTEPVPTNSNVLNKNGVRRVDRDRAAAYSLVLLGSRAVPDLENALGLLERQDRHMRAVPSWRWLLFAYARIRESAAYHRLREMADNPQLRHLSGDVDKSLALALGLTSYISSSRIADSFGCCRAEEPRHALDQLILGWLQGNRLRVEQTLGPRAKSALASLLAQNSWLDLRNRIWHGVPSSGFALGYRFQNVRDWSKPEETLDQALHDRRRSVDLDQLPLDPTLTAQFVNISGQDCGRSEIRFVRIPATPDWLPSNYLVDDPDLGALLRLISECASMKPN
jgi:hypothetical protein